ncbi:MAG TPA: CHASE2 domain-containing protein [Alphaproteobacteria bacterium]|nr:CHASE2 domain-containing protein [Alphaproteobacteria bacterium]
MRRLRRSWISAILVSAMTIGLHWAGFFVPLEHALDDVRFRLLPRPASGGIVLVQVDSRSLEALPDWPLPREIHARTVRNLLEADAEMVAVNIDLGTPSTPADDAAFESVLRLAQDRVVLPIFERHRVIGSPEEGILLVRPLARFADHATLAAANLQPDVDGLVREYRAMQDVGGTPVPSLAARLAGQDAPPRRFGIDFGIQVETLPRLSYIDVYQGAFDPARIAGKRVILGASAVELGDVSAVPLHRAMSGSVVHALAYESIVQDRTLFRMPPLAVHAGVIGLSLAFGALFLRCRWRAGLATAAAAVGALLVLAVVVQALVPLRPQVLPWSAAVILSFVVAQFHRMDALLRRIFRQSTALLQRTALFTSVVEDSFDGILIANHAGRIKLVNRAGLALLGRTERSLVGRDLKEVLPQLVAPDAFPLLSPGIGIKTGRFEAVLGPPDGPERRFEVSSRSSVVRSGDHPFGGALKRRRPPREVLIIMFRDVTAQREAEEARENAAAEALAASQAKSNFLANMSHELRTPLNAVIGFSEIIRDEMLGPVGNPTYVEYAQDIHRSGSHLLTIIGDILDLSKVEAGITTVADESVDIGAVIDFAVRMVADRAANARIALQVDIAPDAPLLRGDERLLRQVAVNLLSNATKFTPPGGSIDVRVGIDLAGSMILTVADTGIGIPAEELPEIVKPFRQVEGGLNRRYEGAGLGLSLVNSFVELHQGTFVLESVLGEGTTATIRFPAARLRPRPADACHDGPAR